MSIQMNRIIKIDKHETISNSPVIHSFTADANNIDAGDRAILSWSVSNADTLSISPGIGIVMDVSGTATNSAGSTTATVMITVNTSVVEYKLTSSAGESGQISPIGMIAVAEGSSQTFTITPGG